MPRKHTYEEVYEEFKKEGCLLLSEVYVDNRTKLKYKCSCGNISFISLSNFKKGRRCKSCGIEKIKTSNKFTLEEVQDYFKKEGCKLLSTDYINNYQKLDYICNCGEKAKITFESFKQGQRCRKCKNERIGISKSLSFEYVKKFFTDNGCTLLSKTYKNNAEKLKYICTCGNISEIRFSRFQRGSRCKKCANTGENNYNWKGGISPLHEYLRQHILEWKKESLKKTKNKCIITGKTSNLVHHLYNFNKILKEVLEQTNLPIYTEINFYTKEELILLKKVNLELHFKYGLGACLNNDIHKLFHSLYGYGNNTLKQFEEFKNLYHITPQFEGDFLFSQVEGVFNC